MQKISDSTSSADSAGEFTEGNPAGGVPATQIKAKWLNAVQRELLNLITGSGLSQDSEDDSQAYKAVLRIAKSAAEFGNVGNKPTTLSGYGIADAYTKTQVDSLLTGKAAQAATLSGYGITDAYTQAQVNTLLASKAGSATTLAGYGIADAYTKTQVDSLLTGKATKATTLSGYGIADAYTQAQVNSLLASKAGSATTLAGYGIVDAYTQAQVNNLLSSKASSATTLGGYGITDAYTRNAIDNLLSVKLAIADIGWGGVALDFPGNDLNTPLGRSGLYRTTYDALNIPPGATAQGGVVRHEVWGSGVFQQTFYEHVTGREWHRAINAGVFGGWLESTTNMAGAIVAFAMTSPPDGYLIANGATVSRAAYPTLFNRIGTRYGAGNGTTTFVLPDLRGEVIRGYDDGRGIDPGRGFGSVQLDALQGHGHQNTAQRNGSSGGTGEFLSHSNGISSEQLTGRILGPINLSGYGSVRVATETRMRNIALLYCIKY